MRCRWLSVALSKGSLRVFGWGKLVCGKNFAPFFKTQALSPDTLLRWAPAIVLNLLRSAATVVQSAATVGSALLTL